MWVSTVVRDLLGLARNLLSTMAKNLPSVARDLLSVDKVLLSVTRDLLFGQGSGKCGVRLVGEGSVRNGKVSAKSVSGFF